MPTNIAANPVAVALPGETRNYRAVMVTVTTLFFVWGFLTSLNDILVPHFKRIFGLSYTQVMLIQFAFFLSYFLFSIPSSKVIDWIGYQKTMVVGLAAMALGAFLLIPAAGLLSFPLVLTALMVLGMGITALQVAANPYVTVLGPAKTASSRLNLTQAFNSLGTTIGPPLGGLFILSASSKASEEMRRMSAQALHAYCLHEASSVKLPYLGLCLALVVLGIVIAKANLPPIPEAQQRGGSPGRGASIWRHRHLVLGAVGIFVYVGAEVAIGSFLINYLSQPAIGNISASLASRFVAVYWGGAMVGRFIGSAILRKVHTGALLAVVAIGAFLLVITSSMTNGHLAMWSILMVGLCNSIMFPSIFALGVAELGPLTGDGSGILVMAIVGGAIIPEIQGALADHIGIQHAFILPALCYLYILYYALRGSRPAVRTAS